MRESTLAFIDTWGAGIGISGLILFMVFIIWDLAKQDKAGRFGTVILFITLGAGMMGFVIKVGLQLLIDNGQI